MTRFDLWPLYEGSYDKVTNWLFWSFVYCLQNDIISFEIRAFFIFFTWLTFLTPCDPYMTFEVKLLINFVATYPLVILTKLHDCAMLSVGRVAF